jgi:23S rRNA G2069 N7-methylase RlmK/C1962 C5-methylase RlmI
MLGNRLRKRHKHLSRWARREGVDCYRLYDRDIPEIPLAVDWYAGHLHLALWRRRGVAVAEDEGAWLDAMATAASGALGIPQENVATKRREKQKGAAQYERQGARGRFVEVREGELRFGVNLWDYLDTGLFLDHRPTRRLVATESPGKRVLNLYSYTGSFGVYAAAAGAERVVQVDLSNTYLRWAEDNLRRNDLLRPQDARVRSDVFRYLDETAASGERFDLAVVDPPTFSNSKRTAGTFDVRRDHPELLRAVLRVLTPSGVLYFSTNARGFSIDTSSLARVTVEDITERTIPEDFTGRHSHRAWRLLPIP